MSLIVGHTSGIRNAFALEISQSRRALACSVVLRAIFRALLTRFFPVFREKVAAAQLPDSQGFSLLPLPRLNFHLRASLLTLS